MSEFFSRLNVSLQSLNARNIFRFLRQLLELAKSASKKQFFRISRRSLSFALQRAATIWASLLANDKDNSQCFLIKYREENSMHLNPRAKMAIDIMMTILSIILMGGTMLFPDDRVHQILGAFLFVFFIIHIVFNHRWYNSIFRGKFPPYRIMQISVILAVDLSALCLMISGLMMAFMLPGLGFARSVHLAASHWYYIFMCAHIGMHVGMIFSKIKFLGSKPNKSKFVLIFQHVVLALVCIYGIYAFIIRGIWKYLFLSQQFFFFDIERGYILFAVDYIAILILIATISYYLGKFLQKK